MISWIGSGLGLGSLLTRNNLTHTFMSHACPANTHAHDLTTCVHVFLTKYTHTGTHAQTRNACTYTYTGTQSSHRRSEKHKTPTYIHQQAQTQACAHVQYNQQTHKNVNKHEHSRNHMCAHKEVANDHTWVA